ncbi:MAG: 4-alpha-glucanotransferase [Chlamydiia bacterium]|nr:4-alpha-glucanotransferase [Chlamydiia bacterium]
MDKIYGINTPLLALTTKRSAGNGEFLDLLPLIDWCQRVGLKVIQLLPLNDSGLDPSPYNALSSVALNPIYISLHALIDHRLSHYNTTSRVDYRRLYPLKEEMLLAYADKQKHNHPHFQNFLKEHPWSLEYGHFKDPAAAESHAFIQLLAHEQLNQVKAYAEQRGVQLMGDIPILISRDSHDVRDHPAIFDRDLAVGTPPDIYAADGQAWEFPLLDWDAMADRNYAWWAQRLKVAENYYHYFRIDHAVGFYRFWAYPQGEKASTGRFIPQDPTNWVAHGERNLQGILAYTHMIPIAEDLGDDVPLDVKQSLLDQRIHLNKVIRWESVPPSDYPHLSLATVSTHDTETLRQWWTNHPEEAHTYCHLMNRPYTPTPPLFDLLRDSNQSASHLTINLFQETLTLLPAYHFPNPDDERINIPGTLSPTNWIFRYKQPLEHITADSKLAALFLSGQA